MAEVPDDIFLFIAFFFQCETSIAAHQKTLTIGMVLGKVSNLKLSRSQPGFSL